MLWPLVFAQISLSMRIDRGGELLLTRNQATLTVRKLNLCLVNLSRSAVSFGSSSDIWQPLHCGITDEIKVESFNSHDIAKHRQTENSVAKRGLLLLAKWVWALAWIANSFSCSHWCLKWMASGRDPGGFMDTSAHLATSDDWQTATTVLIIVSCTAQDHLSHYQPGRCQENQHVFSAAGLWCVKSKRVTRILTGWAHISGEKSLPLVRRVVLTGVSVSGGDTRSAHFPATSRLVCVLVIGPLGTVVDLWLCNLHLDKLLFAYIRDYLFTAI